MEDRYVIERRTKTLQKKTENHFYALKFLSQIIFQNKLFPLFFFFILIQYFISFVILLSTFPHNEVVAVSHILFIYF